MRILSVILIVVFIQTIFYAQETADQKQETVPFVAYWSLGDSYDFRITKIKKEWKEGILAREDSSVYIANFKVIDSTATNYKIRWKFKTNLKGFQLPPKIVEKLVQEYPKYMVTEVVYITDEFGAFVEIENWEEVALMMKNLFYGVIDILTEEKPEKREEIERSLQPIIQMYTTKEGIALYVLNELALFHFMIGGEFETQKPIIYKDAFPNMLGGDPIRADGKIYFETVDRDRAFCVLVNEVDANSKDVNRVIEEFTEYMMKNADLDKKERKKSKKMLKKSDIEISYVAKFEFYYYPCIPQKIEAVRKIYSKFQDQRKRVETVRIELLD
ncbi:MAG: hypothetical protein MK212_16595 [Saprospiraceae bacterium]|nr:hypothetical protein [Saprospiraceae bacterium]